MESRGTDTVVPSPLSLSQKRQSGSTPAILLPYVAIWMNLRDRKKLALGVIVGIMIKLCVIYVFTLGI